MRNNLNTTVCQCGYEMTAKDIRPPFETPEHGFYGGAVKRLSRATCECGREYKLYIKPIRQSWEVLDMEYGVPVPVEEGAGPNYNVMTNKELEEWALSMGLDPSKCRNKAQYIELITTA